MACLIMLLMCPPVNHNTVEFQLFHFRIFKNHEMFLNPIRLRVWYFCPYQPCFNLVKTSFSSINVITRRFLSKCNQAKVLRRTVHAELIIFSNIKSREAPILRIEMTAILSDWDSVVCWFSNTFKHRKNFGKILGIQWINLCGALKS